MKTLTLIAALALCATVASAQLDQILSPVSTSPAVAAQAPGASLPADPQPAAPAVLDPAAPVHLTLTGDDLVNELQKQLVSYFGIKGDLKLSLISPWTTIQLPGKDCNITLTDYPPNGVSGNFTLRFKITSGALQVGEWQLGLRAQLWQSVWVTQGRLDRGQPLDRTLLNSQKVDVLRDKRTLLSDDTDPDGYDVAQGIGPGQPISKQDVVDRPLIHRGDVVEVVAVQGLLDIHMKALAMEDGGANAIIKMRNLDSSKDFNAQILNEDEVKVHF
jgi:flagella basal body P-ring formation protein FlgA